MPGVRCCCVIILVSIAGCRSDVKPVEVMESGWIISCSDQSDAKSSSQGLPFMLFQTEVGGHFDTFVFSSNNVPKCETWTKWDVHELDMSEPTNRDYEITVMQHVNWLGKTDGTWDLLKMHALASR
jgi:hypothetical protein